MAGAPEITVGTAPELSSGTSANRRREAVAGGYPTTRTCQGINRPSRSGSLRVVHRPTPHLVRRGHPFVREVEHHPFAAWNRLWQWSIQIPGLSARNATSHTSPSPTSNVSIHSGLPVTGFPLRDSTST